MGWQDVRSHTLPGQPEAPCNVAEAGRVQGLSSSSNSRQARGHPQHRRDATLGALSDPRNRVVKSCFRSVVGNCWPSRRYATAQGAQASNGGQEPVPGVCPAREGRLMIGRLEPRSAIGFDPAPAFDWRADDTGGCDHLVRDRPRGTGGIAGGPCRGDRGRFGRQIRSRQAGGCSGGRSPRRTPARGGPQRAPPSDPVRRSAGSSDPISIAVPSRPARAAPAATWARAVPAPASVLRARITPSAISPHSSVILGNRAER